ncbi:uncharacterized protein BBA_09623 [Beauveria bassiana ARSEF 2860]|uniref:Uncharacterized protein n=1 Tax=Beauveria bassiana (strain ARSEF 2860) TaxID=655819 RepID=J5J3Z6_BEAB2|nr:uncharacterized protein BBA_09623 [Beauveria bassiana ARSEF 2860]EJP61433.1 hypothetical protein BBA_09623 [Beauveria bassiana ARSEF 2860]
MTASEQSEPHKLSWMLEAVRKRQRMPRDGKKRYYNAKEGEETKGGREFLRAGIAAWVVYDVNRVSAEGGCTFGGQTKLYERMVALEEEAAEDPEALRQQATTLLKRMQDKEAMEFIDRFAKTIDSNYVSQSGFKPGKRKLIESAILHNGERRANLAQARTATQHDGCATAPVADTATMLAVRRSTKASDTFGAFLGLSPSKASLLFPAELLAKVQALEQRTGTSDLLLDIGMAFVVGKLRWGCIVHVKVQPQYVSSLALRLTGIEFEEAGGVRFMSSQNCRILPNSNLILCGLNPEALREHCCDDIFQACLPREVEESNALWPSASSSFSIPASSHEAGELVFRIDSAVGSKLKGRLFPK